MGYFKLSRHLGQRTAHACHKRQSKTPENWQWLISSSSDRSLLLILPTLDGLSRVMSCFATRNAVDDEFPVDAKVLFRPDVESGHQPFFPRRRMPGAESTKLVHLTFVPIMTHLRVVDRGNKFVRRHAIAHLHG